MRKFVVAIIGALLIFSFAIFPTSIPNLSAEPTVAVKDFLSVSTSPLGGNPQGPPPGLGPKPNPPPGPAPNKWAVVIGISKYADPSANLYNPANDAKEMAKALKSLYGFADENIKLLTNNVATVDNIVASITWLIDNENATSTVVFFYCGHGGQVDEGTYSEIYPNDEVDGKDEYIVTYDLWGITDDYLKYRFLDIESTQFFLWFGSCHSGGMSPDLNGDGRVIVAACQENEVAWDYLLLHNTLFGYYYIDQGMLRKLGDTNGDGIVTVEEAFNYAAPLVTTQEPGQHPFIWDSDPTSDLYL